MKRRPVLILILLGISFMFALASCSGAPTAAPAADAGVEVEPPAEYAGKTNPVDGKAAEIDAGKGIYNSNCASCHGDKAMGDGPAAKSLNPPPKSLAAEGSLSDGYLYWRIAEGGGMAPFKSAMPAWKTFLSEEQIWQVIAYLRTLMS